jgi:hypothetical protein
MQAVEIRSTVDAEQNSLAIDHQGRIAVAQRGLRYQRVSIGPVVAVAREQPNALAVALNDQAIAVVLDFVDPVFRFRNLGAGRRDAGLER